MVAEADRSGVPALLAADADLEVRPHRAAVPDRHVDQLADALDVEHLERVVLQDARLVVHRQELVLGVLAGERERRLGEVVGAEGEELGTRGQLLRQTVVKQSIFVLKRTYQT